MTAGANALADSLERVVGAQIAGLRRLSAGASRETWAMDAEGRGLILRRDPPAAPDAAGMAREADCFRACARAGVPVPALVAHGDGTDGVGSPYLLMERLDGETIPHRLLREDRWATVRPKLVHQFGEILGRIHAIAPAEVPRLEEDGDPLTRLRESHAVFGEDRPAMELIFRRLERTRPEPVPPTLVHGDFRNGNLLIDDGGVRAVLDWELAHIGDPREDLGWLCARAWRFGERPEVGGFGSFEDLLASYGRATGAYPDPEAVRWWEAYACARWAVLCRIQAERHLGGTEQSVELAVLGRRIAEAEHDALLALGLTGAEVIADPLREHAPVEQPDMYDRPTIDELLNAVTGFLREELTTEDPRSAYLAKVSANALTIVRREMRLGREERAAHRTRLAAIGCADDGELAARIRNGTVPDDDPDIVAVVRSSITAQVVVANPRYLAPARST
ncbi:phosphotransferase family protein [Nocardia xishanensis]|uniref:phosphotransferase family protein n=1 Tax=Nocardia xishanensis TaxID=238964 RepID=UPI000829ABAB|nr:phosphotransferase family protein [Nocardia xishanensis]